MDDYDPASLPANEAYELILEAITPIQEFEKVAIRDALGRILAEDITSKINVPTGTNSAMDGYAISGKDLPDEGIQKLKVVGTVFAGKPYKEKFLPRKCVRIMTGGILPKGTDTVVIPENV